MPAQKMPLRAVALLLVLVGVTTAACVAETTPNGDGQPTREQTSDNDDANMGGPKDDVPDGSTQNVDAAMDAAADDATTAQDAEPDVPLEDEGPLPDDPDPEPDPDPAVLGSWERPIVVEALPFTDQRDTRQPAAQQVDAYLPCAPDTDEGGGEFVYRLEAAVDGVLNVSINEVPGDGIDVDVHILDAPDPMSCRARGHAEASLSVGAGQTLWVVVDTWVDGEGRAQAGPNTWTVRLREADEPGDPQDCFTGPIAGEDNQAPGPSNLPAQSPGGPGCPDGMARVDNFCVDRYEAALMQVNNDNTLTPWSPYLNPGQTRVRAWSAAGVVPQGYITQVQASQACQQAGKRLCTDNEWLRACQGSQGRTYPYGSTFEAGACNTVRTCHPVVQYFESNQNWVWSRLGHSCINQLPEGLAPTGQYSACVTDEGIHDMSGNLHEWTSDPTGTFRGGFYVDAVRNGPGCLYRTTAHNTQHWDYSTGFRCCASAQ